MKKGWYIESKVGKGWVLSTTKDTVTISSRKTILAYLCETITVDKSLITKALPPYFYKIRVYDDDRNDYDYDDLNKAKQAFKQLCKKCNNVYLMKYDRRTGEWKEDLYEK